MRSVLDLSIIYIDHFMIVISIISTRSLGYFHLYFILKIKFLSIQSINLVLSYFLCILLLKNNIVNDEEFKIIKQHH